MRFVIPAIAAALLAIIVPALRHVIPALWKAIPWSKGGKVIEEVLTPEALYLKFSTQSGSAKYIEYENFVKIGVEYPPADIANMILESSKSMDSKVCHAVWRTAARRLLSKSISSLPDDLKISSSDYRLSSSFSGMNVFVGMSVGTPIGQIAFSNDPLQNPGVIIAEIDTPCGTFGLAKYEFPLCYLAIDHCTARIFREQNRQIKQDVNTAANDLTASRIVNALSPK